MADITDNSGSGTVNGTNDADDISLAPGTYVVNAGDGNDVIHLAASDGASIWGSVYNGGAGDDTLDASAITQRLRVVETGTPTFGYPVTQVSGIEHLVGGAGSDIFVMALNTAGVTIDAGAGNDILVGGSGNDILNGGAGNDIAGLFGMYRSFTYSYADGNGSFTSPATGTDTLTSIETVYFKDGLITTDPDSHAASADRLFLSLNGRDADPATLDAWTHALDHGASLASIADAALATSGTASLGNSDYVAYLYHQLLGRDPDASGLSYWSSMLDQGSTRGTVLAALSESAEHRADTAGHVAAGLMVTNEAYQAVAAFYDASLGRLPDQGGIDQWVFKLLTGSTTLDGVADGFANSSEFETLTQGMSHTQLVDYMYHTALHRDADASGEAYWVNALDHGLSDAQLIETFALSSEHLSLISDNIHAGVLVG